MKKIILILISFFTYISVFAQQSEIGFSIWMFQASHRSITIIQSNSSNSNNILRQSNGSGFGNINIPIQYNYVLKNNLNLIVQYVFFFDNEKSDSKTTANFSSNYETYISKLKSRTHHFAFGIGKRFSAEKFILETALMLPIEYNYYNKTNYTHDYFNASSNVLTTGFGHSYLQNTLSLGLYLSQSVYYKVYPHFYLGLNLMAGYYTDIKNGTWDILNVTKDNTTGNTSISTQSLHYHNDMSFSNNFIPMLSLKYILKKKEAGK